MRISSLAATLSHFAISNLNRSLFNQLVVVLVFLRNLRVRILIIPRAHLLAHHFVLRSVDMALQKVTQVRVIIRLALILTQKAGNLILLRVVCVEYRILS